jgi:N-acetylmuramoyl-L-alanine amidase
MSSTAPGERAVPFVSHVPSPNFEPRPPSAIIDLIVLHYTGMQDGPTALARLTDPSPVAGRYPGPWQAPQTPALTPLGRVSAHYLIDTDGRIFALVDEACAAWHAGTSSWRGKVGLNASSIGIELVNGGHDFGLPPYPERQIECLIELLRDIIDRRGLGRHSVVGHSDIAPMRKDDPGEHFPWSLLEAAGVADRLVSTTHDRTTILRAGDQGPAVRTLQLLISRAGYDVRPSGEYDLSTAAAVRAFQRRRRRELVSGETDRETLALLEAAAGKG